MIFWNSLSSISIERTNDISIVWQKHFSKWRTFPVFFHIQDSLEDFLPVSSVVDQFFLLLLKINIVFTLMWRFRTNFLNFHNFGDCSETSKKSSNVDKSCPKMISLEKLKNLTPLQKLPKNVGDLDKLIVSKGFKKLPKVQ